MPSQIPFDSEKINIFFRGTDMLIACPRDLFSQPIKGAALEMKAKGSMAIIFRIDPKLLVDNHDYKELPDKGWVCWRVRNGKAPRQIYNPEKPNLFWDKENLVIHKDKEPSVDHGKPLPKAGAKADQPTQEPPMATIPGNYVLIDSKVLFALMKDMEELTASNRALHESITKAGFKLNA